MYQHQAKNVPMLEVSSTFWHTYGKNDILHLELSNKIALVACLVNKLYMCIIYVSRAPCLSVIAIRNWLATFKSVQIGIQIRKRPSWASITPNFGQNQCGLRELIRKCPFGWFTLMVWIIFLLHKGCVSISKKKIYIFYPARIHVYCSHVSSIQNYIYTPVPGVSSPVEDRLAQNRLAAVFNVWCHSSGANPFLTDAS